LLHLEPFGVDGNLQLRPELLLAGGHFVLLDQKGNVGGGVTVEGLFKVISPLVKREAVAVRPMATEDAYANGMLVLIRWQENGRSPGRARSN
jgi:hypothetical protein